MSACASLPAISPAAALPVQQPIVLVHGVPDPALEVRRWRMDGPLSRVEVIFAAARATNHDYLAQLWLRAPVIVAMPHRLNDGQVAWFVLAEGRLVRMQSELSSRADEDLFTLVDGWTEALTQPLENVWREASTGLVADARGAAVLKAGAHGNRSHNLHPVKGRTVHVLEDRGEPWTIGSALATIDAFADTRLSLDLVPEVANQLRLPHSIDLRQPRERVLSQLLAPLGLVVQRHGDLQGATAVEARAVRPLAHGRPIRLPWPQGHASHGQALRVRSEKPLDAAQPWIAQATGWVIESTFDLRGGWSVALEGEPDDHYSRSQSPDFATYADVYRRWALNEDGAFCDASFGEQPAFDLAEFFEQEEVSRQAMRLLSCVTLDDTGSARDPIVEMSTDAGATWTAYPGQARVLDGRAGVYLDDAELPSAFLAAAKVGDARVRVTASLQSPLPVQAIRWEGNAFAGTLPPRVIHLAEAFAFRRVSAGSLHFPAVSSGTLSAAPSDGAEDLEEYLALRLANSRELEGQATLTLAGSWFAVQVGDRVLSAGGNGLDASGRRELVDAPGATVAGVTCHWPGGSAGQAGPTTTIDLTF